MSGTDTASHGSDRRGNDRRVAQQPFSGEDKRKAERRSGSDRRARRRHEPEA